MTTKKPTQYELNRAKYEPIARAAAIKHGYDPELFVRQINRESGFNPVAKSNVGAYGIAQIMPTTAKGWGVNSADPVASLDVAAKNMASFYHTYRNNGHDDHTSKALALAAYNAGPGNVTKYGTSIYGGKTGISDFDGQTTHYVNGILGGGTQLASAKKQQPPVMPNWYNRTAQAVSNFVTPDARAESLPAWATQTDSRAAILAKANGETQTDSRAAILAKANGETQTDSRAAILAKANGETQQNGPIEALQRTGQIVANAATGAVKGIGDFANQFIEAGKSGALTSELNDYINPGAAIMDHPQQAIERPLAAATGVLKGIRDLAQGVNSLPADLSNAAQYITSGKIADPKVPLSNFMDISPEQKQLLQRNLVSGTAGQLLPLIAPVGAAGKVSKILGISKEVAAPLIEAATGSALDPSEGLSPKQRIEARVGQAELTGAGTLAGVGAAKVGGKILNSLSHADKVQEVMNNLRVSKEAAEQYVSTGQHKAAIDLAKQVKELPRDVLTPEQTAAHKNLDVIGDRKAVLDHLESKGLSPTEATDALKHLETLDVIGGRKTLPDYVARQRADQLINEYLYREGTPIPTDAKSIKAIGGKKALKALQEAPIIERSKQLAKVLNIDPVEAHSIMEGVHSPMEALGTRDFLSWPDRLKSKIGLGGSGILGEDRLIDTTKGGAEIYKKARDNYIPMQHEIAEGRRSLNDIHDALVNSGQDVLPILKGKDPILPLNIIKRGVNAVGTDIRQLLYKKVIKDNTLVRIVEGDTAGIKPEVVQKLQPVADMLKQWNVENNHPLLRNFLKNEDGTPYTGTLNSAKLSNAQFGKQFYHVKLDELAKVLPKQEFNDFVSRYNISRSESPSVGLGYGDDFHKDIIQHLKDAASDYSRPSKYPFFYDQKGKLRENLFDYHDNKIKAQADLKFNNKLSKSQMMDMLGYGVNVSDTHGLNAFVDQFSKKTNLSKAELTKAFTEAVINGNVKSTHWSKFLGALKKSEDKLLLRKSDPFKVLGKQHYDLLKKTYIEPIVNEIRNQKEMLDKQMATNPGKNMGALQDTKDWYDQIERLYTRTPDDLDKHIHKFVETLGNGTPIGREAGKIIRKAGDTFVTAEALGKLGLNAKASSEQITESLIANGSNLHPEDYATIMREFTNHPKDYLFNIVKDIKEVKNNPKLNAVLFQHGIGGLDSGFSASSRMFGSRTLGGAKDGLMYLFQQGTTGGKLLSYKIYETIGKREGFRGEALDNFIITEMIRNKTFPEMGRLPLQQNLVGKVGLLFTSFLVRQGELLHQRAAKVLHNPSTENIRKLVLFDQAPAVLLGAGAGVSTSLLAHVIDSFNGMYGVVTGDDNEPVLDQLRARNSIIAQGLLGHAANKDTSMLARDITQSISTTLPSSLQHISKTIQDVKLAGATGASLGDKAGIINKDLITPEILPLKRMQQVADMERTGSYVDAKGNSLGIPLSEGKWRYADEAATALGAKDLTAAQAQTSAHIYQNAIKAKEDQVKFLHGQLQDAIMNNKSTDEQSAIIDKIVERTLEFPDMESIYKHIDAMSTPIDERVLDALSPKLRALAEDDPKLKPLIKVTEERQKQLERAAIIKRANGGK